ncbi:GNAT family N-acetyltransferase [Labrys sp. LIt4]|uniref:GNAT family N-acetyltransferase n=1 Tax=Labrys sp. LIt4 TaxID=2821355 RepID=UPI001AE06E81|nr:GNAT family N-acetyltransferase [Labrys sp. LIt4]MBP0579958.1 GNAT family N-acetyltransferase [Labrys sp. LIt4]
MSAVNIRSARLDDAKAIADLHVAVWRHAYHALAPSKAFVVLDEEHRFASWHKRLSSPAADQIVLLAEAGAGLVGFAAAGAPTQAVFDGRSEIKHLYVDPLHKRRGVGRALLETMATRLIEQGRRSAAIGVVAGNEPAIAFYEAQGGRQAGSYTDPGPLWRSHNLLYAWDDLEALVRRQPVSSAP